MYLVSPRIPTHKFWRLNNNIKASSVFIHVSSNNIYLSVCLSVCLFVLMSDHNHEPLMNYWTNLPQWILNVNVLAWLKNSKLSGVSFIRKTWFPTYFTSNMENIYQQNYSRKVYGSLGFLQPLLNPILLFTQDLQKNNIS